MSTQTHTSVCLAVSQGGWGTTANRDATGSVQSAGRSCLHRNAQGAQSWGIMGQNATSAAVKIVRGFITMLQHAISMATVSMVARSHGPDGLAANKTVPNFIAPSVEWQQSSTSIATNVKKVISGIIIFCYVSHAVIIAPSPAAPFPGIAVARQAGLAAYVT